MIELTIDFQVISPLYIGDAYQMAELRPPSIKGALRFWYRAIDPRFCQPVDGNSLGGNGKSMTWEDHFFGGIRGEARQSPFLMRIESEAVRYFHWDTKWAERFNVRANQDKAVDRSHDQAPSRGVGVLNGMKYLGYPFHMQASKKPGTEAKRDISGIADRLKDDDAIQFRSAIAPDQKFTVRCLFPKRPDRRMQQAILASFWLLGHLGSLGSRSRRGFGSIALVDWNGSENEWPDKKELPLLHKAVDVNRWGEGLRQALTVFNRWFGSYASKPESADFASLHPHVGGAFRCLLLPKGFATSPQSQGWEMALADAGLAMQKFRSCKSPDYEDVKGHILATMKKQGGRPLQHAPERATFGLPLKFQYRSIKERHPAVTFVPFDQSKNGTFERHASLLHLRLTKVGNRAHPLFIRLDGPVPGIKPPAGISKQATHLRWPKENAMDAFLKSLVRS